MTNKAALWLFATLPLLAACSEMPGPVEAPKSPLSDAVSGTPSPATPPKSIHQPQEGSDQGFVDRDGFFFTLGSGIASLGDPSRQGVWVQGPFLEDGKMVELHCRQTGLSVHAIGHHSKGVLQMSLAAFQALDLSPAALVEVEVRTP